MKVAGVILLAVVGCTGSRANGDPDGGSPPVEAGQANPEAGIGNPEAGSSSAEAGTTPSCAGASVPSFAVTKIASVGGNDSLPSVTVAADGSTRVLFAGGALDQRAIYGADPATGATLKLSKYGPAIAGPRFAATAGGGLRGTYVEQAATTLRYLEWDGNLTGTPADLPVTPDSVRVAPPAIAVDGQGQPVIAALSTSGDLRLLARRAGAWVADTADSKLAVSDPQLGLAFDGAGNPVIAAVEARPSSYDPALVPLGFGVTIWSRAATAWSKTKVHDLAQDLLPQVALAPSGEMTILFAAPDSPPTLADAVRGNGVWQVRAPLADTDGRAVKMVDESAGFDVAFGPNGDIHVVYVPPAGGLGYAVYDGCHWTEFVVAGARDAASPSIALDPAGRPHLAYQNVIPSQGNGTPPDMTEIWYAGPQP